MYIYIKELSKDEELINDIPKILNNIIIKLKKIFNIATKKKIDESHYLYIIPKVNKINEITKIIKKNSNSKIILSKQLKKYQKELNIKENRITKYFIYDILKYIERNTNIKLELQNLYILVNSYNDENVEIIKLLKDKVKTINIITNNLKSYSRLEENMRSNGELIIVTNNKSKSLKRAKFIINLDFDSETISKYKIDRNSIIINCTDEKINILKYFDGIIINNIQIKLIEMQKLEELYREFDMTDIYESFYLKKLKYIDNIKEIENNKIKITNLVGNNGIINTKELLNVYEKY